MPYPQHVDEYHLVVNGMNMSNNENFYPGILCYPSLPIYFSTFILKVAHQFEHKFLLKNQLDNFNLQKYPYYKEQFSVTTTKIFITSTSILIPILLSITILKLTGCQISALFGFVLICFSELFTYHSRAYINLDLFASLFVAANIFYFVFYHNDKNPIWKLIVPGILTGLTIASKYPHGLIILIYFYSFLNDKSQSLSKKVLNCATTLITALFTTLCCCPYILIFFDKWLEEVIKQGEIYKQGWIGYTTEPGFSNFVLQLKQLLQEYGHFVSGLFLVGCLFLISKNRKNGIPIILYSLGFLLYFSTYSVNLIRNLLPVYILYAFIAAIGFYYLSSILKPKFGFKLSTLLLLTLTMISFPKSKIAEVIRIEPESRKLVTNYIHNHINKKSNLIIAKELGFNTNNFIDYNITEFNFLNTDRKTINPKIYNFLSEGDFFIYPIFCADMRWPENDIFAREINDTLASFNPVVFFKGHIGGSDNYLNLSRPGIQINSKPPSPWGNPSIIISRGVQNKQSGVID